MMRFFARVSLGIIIVSSLWIISTNNAKAEGEFQSDYKVQYTIDKSGHTSVVQNIILKNKTPNFYADKFELKIGSTKVADVQARDETGELQTDVKFENNTTSITVSFKQKVIGEGKQLSFVLTYNTNEIATKSGQIWEVSIPKLAKSTDTGIYDAIVSIPRALGPIAFAIPEPVSTNLTLQTQDFTFNKDQLFSTGIAMSFGEKQVFAFNLKYLLTNINLTSQTMDISLPPDNNYQKIVLEDINPKPVDVRVDNDGNFLASYRLSPKQQINVGVKGEVEVFSKPFRKIEKSITQAQIDTYTEPQRYWETDNSFVRDKAQELKTPEKIYQFVSSYLTYNNDRLNQQKIERKGALSAYNNPKDAVCMEFTDLFIAIARAAKIPAREVEGYAYTQNERLRPLSLNLYQGDILHAWPEYWDDKLGWVQIDPTWGATSGGIDYFSKLDFNHVTFIQRGEASTSPIPAGAYKEEKSRNEKTVFVEFAEQLPNPINNAEVNLTLPKKSYSSLPFKLLATLTNTGTTSIIGQDLALSTSGLGENKDSTINIPILPPYATKNYEFRFLTRGIFKKISASAVLSFGQIQQTAPISIEPLYKAAIDPMFILSLVGVTIIVAIGLYLYGRTKHKTKFPISPH